MPACFSSWGRGLCPSDLLPGLHPWTLLGDFCPPDP